MRIIDKIPNKELPFVKYTSYGNNFVIVDESQETLLSEQEKSRFAYQATNVNFGIGSDNFLLVQDCSSAVLEGINQDRKYWETPPSPEGADFIFRMFEPDGAEAFSCANGLMSVARYLNQHHGIKSARILTEIPTHSPKVVRIGSDGRNGSWVNIGFPRRIPASIAADSFTTRLDDIVDKIDGVAITFREHDLQPFSQGQSLAICGYLVFTGEPHLVVFTDSGFSLPELSKMIFISSGKREQKNNRGAENQEKRVSFGTWLIDHIGNCVNRQYAHIFPSGININFVQIRQSEHVLEYRCFERGIYRETLACGTGALAVAAVCRGLGLISDKEMAIWPHRCRWHDPAAQMLVTEAVTGWTIQGTPYPLLRGVFMSAGHTQKAAVDSDLATLMAQLASQSDTGLPAKVNSAMLRR